MVTSTSVNEAPVGLWARFLEWVNERQWRGNALLGALALLYVLWMNLAILAGYLVGHLVGDLAFIGLNHYAPTFVAMVFTEEVLDGGTLIGWAPWLIYTGSALMIVSGLTWWQNKYGPVNTTVTENGGTFTSSKGPNAFAWGSVTLGLIVPFIMGLVTGFW